MTIKLELTEERTQRELSEEEWAFPIWRCSNSSNVYYSSYYDIYRFLFN